MKKGTKKVLIGGAILGGLVLAALFIRDRLLTAGPGKSFKEELKLAWIKGYNKGWKEYGKGVESYPPYDYGEDDLHTAWSLGYSLGRMDKGTDKDHSYKKNPYA